MNKQLLLQTKSPPDGRNIPLKWSVAFASLVGTLFINTIAAYIAIEFARSHLLDQRITDMKGEFEIASFYFLDLIDWFVKNTDQALSTSCIVNQYAARDLIEGKQITNEEWKTSPIAKRCAPANPLMSKSSADYKKILEGWLKNTIKEKEKDQEKDQYIFWGYYHFNQTTRSWQLIVSKGEREFETNRLHDKHEEYLKETLLTKKPYLSEINMMVSPLNGKSKENPNPVITTVSPVFYPNDDTKLFGAIIVSMTINKFIDKLVSREMNNSEPTSEDWPGIGVICIVNETGTILKSTDDKRCRHSDYIKYIKSGMYNNDEMVFFGQLSPITEKICTWLPEVNYCKKIPKEKSESEQSSEIENHFGLLKDISYSDNQESKHYLRMIWIMPEEHQNFHFVESGVPYFYLYLFLIIGFLSAAIIFYLVHNKLKPLEELTASVKEPRNSILEYENFKISDAILKQRNEIGNLGRVLSDLIIRNTLYAKAILENNEKLEKTVRQRTKDLQDKQETLTNALSELGEKQENLTNVLSELEKANKKLETANKNLEAAGKAKNEFVAKMVHEIKTPLQVITFAAESLGEQPTQYGKSTFSQNINEDINEDINDILNSAWELKEIADNMLAYEKKQAGKMQAYKSKIDIMEMIKTELSSRIRRFAQFRKNEFILKIDNDVRIVFSDKQILQSALINLLNNACKFTESGSVTLEVNKRKRNNREEVLFSVTDTGIGITPGQMEKLFQPFEQVDSSVASKYSGTGLGLVNVKNYCEQIGGEIYVESQEGKGSRFIIVIPADDSESHEVEQRNGEVTQSVVHTNNLIRSVLVIDDNIEYREQIRKILEAYGFDVFTSGDGQKGLEMAKKIHPGVVLLDIIMQGLDGWTVLTRIKSNIETADIPVIIVSQTQDKPVACELADDYLTKPFDKQGLIKILLKYTDRRGQRSPRVLIIDDEEKIRRGMGNFLSNTGWEVILAENGRIGLERIKQKCPDVIILDLVMPEMNGFEFIEHIKKKPDSRLKNTPIIILTGMPISDVERAALDDHVQQIISKSGCTPIDLANSVRKLAKQRRSLLNYP